MSLNRADLVGEIVTGDIVHLKFMSKNQKLFELRMAGYDVEIYQAEGKHPYQLLVYDRTAEGLDSLSYSR